VGNPLSEKHTKSATSYGKILVQNYSNILGGDNLRRFHGNLMKYQHPFTTSVWYIVQQLLYIKN